MPSRLATLLLASALLVLSPTAAHAGKFKVLDFWGVGGYAHGSRPIANVYLDSLALVMDFDLVKTEDPKVFTAENLATVQVVVLNNCTTLGKILDVNQRSALMAFMRTKGVVAWHASSDIGGSWPEYAGYLGAEFKSHGAGIGTIRREAANASHPVLSGLADTARFDEEWYAFKSSPRIAPNVKVLYTLDEASCKNPCSEPMGDHPIVWIRSEPTGGRLFYSAMGHMDHIFQKLLLTRTMYKQALEWAVSATAAPVRFQGMNPGFGEGLKVEWRGAGLEVNVTGLGEHVLGIRSLDGRTLAVRSGQGPMQYRFPNLVAPAPYTLTVSGAGGKSVRLVR